MKKFASDTGQREVPNGVKSITVNVIERPAPSIDSHRTLQTSGVDSWSPEKK